MRLQIAEDSSDLRPLLEEIFCEKWNHLLTDDLVNIRTRIASDEMSIPNLVLAILEIFDPIVDCGQ